MKGYLFIFAFIFIILPTLSQDESDDYHLTNAHIGYGPILHSFRRSVCLTKEDNEVCNNICRRIGRPGGGCVWNICDCELY